MEQKPSNTMEITEPSDNNAIGKLNQLPERAFGDYQISKMQTKVAFLPPHWDSAGDECELVCVTNKREHSVMLQLQQEMLENVSQQAAVNNRRTYEIQKHQGVMRRHLIATNFFLKDCDEKRLAAQKKVKQEVGLHRELSENMQKLKKSMQDLTEFRSMLKRTVNDMAPYERVLRDVVERSPIYVSINDCMNRCDALMLAQVDIQRGQQSSLIDIEEMTHRMKVLTNKVKLKILGLMNDLTELERSYNTARNRCAHWEKILGYVRRVSDMNGLYKERALDGLFHIYDLLCSRSNTAKSLSRSKAEQVLDFIKDETELLREVVYACKKAKSSKPKSQVRCI